MMTAGCSRLAYNIQDSILLQLSSKGIELLAGAQKQKVNVCERQLINGRVTSRMAVSTAISSIELMDSRSTRGRVQILLTDKPETLKLGIQLESILPEGSRKKIPRIVV